MTKRRNPFSNPVKRHPTRPDLDAPPKPIGRSIDLERCVILLPTGSIDFDAAAAKAAHAVASGRTILVLSAEAPDKLMELGAHAVADVGSGGIAPLLTQLDATAIVLPDDGGPSSDLGRRMAINAGLTVAARVVELQGSTIRSRTNTPGCEMEQPTPVVILVDRRFAGHPVAPRIPEPVKPPEVDPIDLWTGATCTGTIEPDPEAQSPREANIVAAAGAGVADLKLFHRFARLCGAATGASRILSDTGRMPRSRQIGASGLKVSANLYIAFGISGAVQHLEGIESCGRVVAVNTDRTCPMAARADVTLIGDAGKVMLAACNSIECGQ